MTNRESLTRELASLTSARQPASAAFAKRRVARIAEIEAALAALPTNEPAQDEGYERWLKMQKRGDRFGR